MTNHTSISTTSPARRAAIGLMALGLLLSGCAAGPMAESPSATPTPMADPHQIFLQIGATFPTEGEWLEDYESGSLCTAEAPGLNDCGTEVRIPVTTSSASDLRVTAAVTTKFVSMAVSEWESEDAAQNAVDESEAAEAMYIGDFDIPMDQETRVVGARGSGTLVGLERDGWSGFKLSRLSEMTGDGGVGVDPLSSTIVIEMTHGPIKFSLRVERASSEPEVVDAEVNAWLDRVFGPE